MTAALLLAALAQCANHAAATSAPGRHSAALGRFFLEEADGSGTTQVFDFGPSGAAWLPVAGDWDGDGFDSVGLYDPLASAFHLVNRNATGPAALTFVFGSPGAGWLPIAGDWNGDGRDSIGLFDPATARFHLRNALGPGPADLTFAFGPPGAGWLPVAGDWNGDGRDSVGLFAPATSVFHLRDQNGAGPADRTFAFGAAGSGWLPVTGDWNGDGRDSVGLWDRAARFHLRNATAPGPADRTFGVPMPATLWAPRAPAAFAGRWRPARCRAAGEGTAPAGPDWLRELILYELRIEGFTDRGTLRDARERLGELASLGVTGLLLDPVARFHRSATRAAADNAYRLVEPGRVDPRLGSEADLCDFVRDAHRLGMRVLLDQVTNGVREDGPHAGGPPEPGVTALPIDWFRRGALGARLTAWSGQAQLDWSVPQLQAWWSALVTHWVRSTDVDGFRLDLEPAYAGAAFWAGVREQVRAATGKTICLISEGGGPRGHAFDFSQHDTGYLPPGGHGGLRGTFQGGGNVVEELHACREPWLGATLSDHDYAEYSARGRLGPFGYGMLLSPCVPQWFMGEEFDAPARIPEGRTCLYFSPLDRSARDRPANRAFLESVRKLIRIRKEQAAILTPPRAALADLTVARVPDSGGMDLEPYAIANGPAAIVVAAKDAWPAGVQEARLVVPLDALGLGGRRVFRITNLLAGGTTVRSREAMDAPLRFELAEGGLAAFRVDALE
jgi:hypothetical protein